MENYKWIGLVRKFHNCSFYNDSNAVQMFLHIFLNAQREDRPYFDQITMRGQFRTSIKDIMNFLEISRKSARRSLDKLKAAGVIHVASLRRNGVLITVRDYSKFLSLENMRGGWVKLYYDLDYQDFFVDAQVLHLYLHILLHTYSANENYEDPLWFDFKKISSLTNISVEGVKTGLQKLRKHGVLSVSYNGQKKLSSVQLIEFSHYLENTNPVRCIASPVGSIDAAASCSGTEMLFAEDAVVLAENVGSKANQEETIEGPKDFQEQSPPDTYESFTNISAKSSKPTVCKYIGQKEGQKTTQKSPSKNVLKTPPNAYGAGYAREHIFKENRDKRIKRDYNYYNSPARKFSSVEELVLDGEWVRSMQRLYGFADKETLYCVLTLFLENLKCRKEPVPEYLKDFLDYFCNWYKRNEKSLRHRLTTQLPPQDYGKVLWGKCMSAFDKIMGKQVFESVFQKISFHSFDNATKKLTLGLPDRYMYHTLEDGYIDTLSVVLKKIFGSGITLQYRIVKN